LCDPRRRGPLAAYPEARADRRCRLCCQSPLLPYLALLQVGFAMPALLPRPRCALTAPFHPCRLPRREPRELGRSALCCTFRRLAPPRRYLAPDPPEPGLSSPPTCVGAAIARPAPRSSISPGEPTAQSLSGGAEGLLCWMRAYASARVAPVSWAAMAAARLGESSLESRSTARRSRAVSIPAAARAAPATMIVISPRLKLSSALAFAASSASVPR